MEKNLKLSYNGAALERYQQARVDAAIEGMVLLPEYRALEAELLVSDLGTEEQIKYIKLFAAQRRGALAAE